MDEIKQTSGGTEDKIAELCHGLKPCCAMACPVQRAFITIIIFAFYIAACVCFLGPRDDLAVKFTESHYVFSFILSFLIGSTAIISAMILMVPDKRGYNWFVITPFILAFVKVLWVVVHVSLNPLVTEVKTEWLSGCFKDALLFGGIPALLLVFTLRKGASVSPYLSGLCVALAVLSFGWLGIRMTCPVDEIMRVYCFDLLPFTLAGIIIGGLARKLFKW